MGRFLKWIVNIILLCAIVVAAALLVPPLVGVTTVMIDRVDMDTNLAAGSVTYARDVDISEIEVGDNVLISESGSEYVYRVKSLDTSDGSCRLEDTRTSGGDEVTRTFRQEVSKVVLTVPFIGYIPMAMRSTEGLIVIGLAVVFVIILFILAELWRPDRDEDAEEEDEEEESEEEEPVRRRPVHMDTPSQIMEEASSEIASVVSSVVAEETHQKEEWREQVSEAAAEPALENGVPEAEEEDSELEEIDRKLRNASGYQAEEGALRDEDMEEPEEEDAVILSLEEDMREEMNAEDAAEEKTQPGWEVENVQEKEEETTEDLPEPEIIEDEIEEAVQPEAEQEEQAAEDEMNWQEPEEEIPEEGEEQKKGQRLAMPLYTAEELLARAKEKGEEPKVVKDEKSGVTILDYSDLL
ncbi:MAG: hypothetical protein ACOX8H_13205 [Ruminococcus sp.]